MRKSKKGAGVETLLSWESGQNQGKSEEWSGKGAKRVWGLRKQFVLLRDPQRRFAPTPNVVAPLNRLNAILSLLHPLDRCRTHPPLR